ncbi:MAG: SelB domain-containing protein, partial [Dehalococcoidia bacterium]
NLTLYSQPGFQRLTDRATAMVNAYLKERPLRAGMGREELKSRLGLNPKLFGSVLEQWVATRVFVEHGASVAPPDHTPRLSRTQQTDADRFLALLRSNPYAPPVETLPDRELIAYLADSGTVVPVSDTVVFDGAAYRQMTDRIVAHLQTNGMITLAEVRDLFGTSRRYAQALLEHLDDRRITRRVGDERVLRSPEGTPR